MLMQPSDIQLVEIATLIDNEIIRPVIDRIYSFDEIDKAIACSKTRRATGKIIVSQSQAKTASDADVYVID